MNRRIPIVLCLLTSSFFIGLSYGDDHAGSPDTISVVVSGTGSDADSAMKQALSNAVNDAVGTIVDAETVVKNDQIIRDQILTAANGLVTHAEQIGVPHVSGGLTTVRIKAVVQRKDLTNRLQQANIITRQVDIQKELRGEASKADAVKLTAKVFHDFPGCVLKAEAVGDPTIVSEGADAPKAIVQVRFSIDKAKYTKWVEDSLPVLIAIATRTESGTFDPESMGTPASSNSDELKNGERRGDNVTISGADLSKSFIMRTWGLFPQNQIPNENCLIIVSRTGSAKTTCLHVDPTIYSELAKAWFNVPVVEVALKNGKGEDIARKTRSAIFLADAQLGANPFRIAVRGFGSFIAPFSVNNTMLLPNFVPSNEQIGQVNGVIVVAPYVADSAPMGTFHPGFMYQFVFKLDSGDDVKAIKTVETKIYSVNWQDSAPASK